MKTALITGVSSGMGFAVTQRLLAQGWQVTGLARRASSVFVDVPEYTAIDVDLADVDQLDERVGEALRHCYNAVICCAGYGRFGCLEEFSLQQIRQLMDVNFTAHVWLLRQLIPQLKRAGAGDIIIMGSESALSGGKKGAIYCASKFALRGLAQSLRDECARNGVRVTLINPGMVETPFFHALDFRPGESGDNAIRVDDVAAAILMVLELPAHTVVDEINLSPLKKVVQSKK